MTISFQIFASPEQMEALDATMKDSQLGSRLAADLNSKGVEAEVGQMEVGAVDATMMREGEVWLLVDGTYMLVKCPRYVVIHTNMHASLSDSMIPLL